MRPFRFGLQAARVNEPAAWTALARWAEDSGYATFMVPDHLGRLSTFPALMAAAAATRTIKLASYVLNQDWRPPGILAQEVASVQLLTGGRLELGIGAGWAKREYLRVGLQFDDGPTRVDRFEEYLQVVKGILGAGSGSPFSFAGKFFQIDAYPSLQPALYPPPPILVGGGSPRILSIAGRLADIISVSTRATPDGRVDAPNITVDAIDKKIERIRQAAGDRFGQIELNVTIREVRVTDDRRAAARALLGEWTGAPNGMMANAEGMTEQDILDSPYIAIGTIDEIVSQLEAGRERWDFNYVEIASPDAEAIAPAVARLAGR